MRKVGRLVSVATTVKLCPRQNVTMKQLTNAICARQGVVWLFCEAFCTEKRQHRIRPAREADDWPRASVWSRSLAKSKCEKLMVGRVQAIAKQTLICFFKTASKQSSSDGLSLTSRLISWHSGSAAFFVRRRSNAGEERETLWKVLEKREPCGTRSHVQFV